MSDHRSQRLAHGTIDCYQTNRCRCKKCISVWKMYTTEFRENIFDETKAKYKEVPWLKDS